MAEVDKILDKDVILNVELKLEYEFNPGTTRGDQLRHIYNVLNGSKRPFFISSFDFTTCVMAKQHGVASVVYLMHSWKWDDFRGYLDFMNYETVMKEIDLARQIGLDALMFSKSSFDKWSEEEREELMAYSDKVRSGKEHGPQVSLYGIKDTDENQYDRFPITVVDFYNK